MFGKKSSEKSAKNVFYIHTNIVTKKWGQQNAWNNFSRNTLIVREKNVWEKFVGKKWEKGFFIFTHNIVSKKCGEKNPRNNFCRNTLTVRSKNVGKKIVRIKCEKRVFIFTQISLQNMGGETRETIFQKHKNSAIKKCREKNRRKKVRKTFFLFTRISWPKNVGNKTR